jgi:hypothetical protein
MSSLRTSQQVYCILLVYVGAPYAFLINCNFTYKKIKIKKQV